MGPPGGIKHAQHTQTYAVGINDYHFHQDAFVGGRLVPLEMFGRRQHQVQVPRDTGVQPTVRSKICNQVEGLEFAHESRGKHSGHGIRETGAATDPRHETIGDHQEYQIVVKGIGPNLGRMNQGNQNPGGQDGGKEHDGRPARPEFHQGLVAGCGHQFVVMGGIVGQFPLSNDGTVEGYIIAGSAVHGARALVVKDVLHSSTA